MSADPLGAAPHARATIYDVARLAGVSPSTVSRALSGAPRVHADTIARVRRAADQLHYTTNVYARALHTGRSHTLGLVLPDIANPAFSGLIQGAERRAAMADYTLVVADSQEDRAAEAVAAERLAASVDGLLLATPRGADAQLQTLAAMTPTVVINRTVPGLRSRIVGLEPGIGDAVSDAASHGHQLALYVPGPHDAWMTQERQRVLAEACDRNGLTLISLGPGASTVERGRATLRAILSSGAHVVFCFSDLLAIGILLEADAQGIVLPDSFSLVGYDDAPAAGYTSPPLSSIFAPTSEAAGAAVEDLLGVLDGRTLETIGAGPPTRYIPRGTTGPRRAG